MRTWLGWIVVLVAIGTLGTVAVDRYQRTHPKVSNAPAVAPYGTPTTMPGDVIAPTTAPTTLMSPP